MRPSVAELLFTTMAEDLNQALSAAGIGPSFYKGHSLCIGAARPQQPYTITVGLLDQQLIHTSHLDTSTPQQLSQVGHILAKSPD